jgi:hypothetical protein
MFILPQFPAERAPGYAEQCSRLLPVAAGLFKRSQDRLPLNGLQSFQHDRLAAAGANAIGWALARFAFEFDYGVSAWAFALGIGGGAACALVGGWLGLRNVLKTPPLASLREA